MSRLTSHWFIAKSDGELSSVERERLVEARRSRLHPHVLVAARPAAPTPRPAAPRVPIPDVRDPLDLHSGLDIQYLAETAFDDFFAPARS